MIRVYFEEYHNDYFRKNHVQAFYGLRDLENWIFDQMRQNYSDKDNGRHVMSFPTPEAAKRIVSEAPWSIEFKPDYDGPTYWIHKIEHNGGILFSDGSMTAKRKHWSKEVQEWCSHCHKRQYNPQFNFIE